MPTASKTGHRKVSPVLPYDTLGSPVSTTPQYHAGQNVLTSIGEQLERYPGFSAGIESSPQVAASTAKVTRQFSWKKWDTASTDGSYYWMKCETDETLNTSRVYKLEVGVDANFSLIHTDSASSRPFDFVVGNNTCFFGNGTTAANMRAFDGVSGATTTRLWGIVAPATAATVATAASATNIDAYVGYKYYYTYCNSSNAHESSPSPVSSCTGLFTDLKVQIGVTASSDTQVDQIRVYRSTDGGSDAPQDCAEITGSPFTNTTQTVDDSTLDEDLGTRFAPAELRNDPPPPASKFGTFANRIWMVHGVNKNQLWYTAFEEMVNGVPEECVPSGADGNYYPYPDQINGLAGLDTLITIATTSTLYGIDGDSLDTFRRYTVSERNGIKSPRNIATLSLEPGTILAAWLDSANTVWMLGLGEIGLPIRPDIENIDHSQSALTIHITGPRRWLLLLDGAGGRLYTYDLDTRLWMPPRIISGYSLHSGETAAGAWALGIGHSSGKVLKLTEGVYNDNGIPYTAHVISNLFDMTPDQNPQWRGVCDYIGVESGATQPSQVRIVTDDDPTTATPLISDATVDADLRTQGVGAKEKYYKFNTPAARRVAYRLDWLAEDNNFAVYGVDVAFHPVGQ